MFVDGLLALWKEKGMTSHDCVFKLRKILKTKKIGHGGTLDPDVEGVLPIAIGKATKVVEYLVDSYKVYEGECTFGISTTTEDASGDIVNQKAVNPEELSEQQIDRAMADFIGEIIQVPPMYSAVRVNGMQLYKYAREGIEVERPKRKAEIKEFIRTSPLTFSKDKKTASFKFKVVCGKGTYVRTLAVDLGNKLNYPSHMSELTRTESSGMHANEAYTLDEVKDYFETDRTSEILRPLELGLKSFPRYNLSDQEWSKVKNGAVFEVNKFEEYSFPLAFFYQDFAVAIYDIHPEKTHLIKPKKVFRNEM